MKRGKDDEKIIGPMFPRLHVNDTEKGGPRAPPRNKMALYEQLSIPSQRFNPGILPLKPNTSSNLIPPPSSSQVNGSDRNVFIPLHLPPSMPTFLPESFNGSESGRVSVMTSFPRVEQRVNTGTEDDCAVPVFVQSGGGYGKSPISKSSENFPPLNPNYAVRTMTSSACSNDPKHCNPNANLRPGVRRVATEPKESGSDLGEKSSENSPKVGSTDRALKAVDESKNQKEARLQTGNSARDYGLEESSRQNEMRLASDLRRDSPAGDVQSGNDGEQLRDERSDDGSDASIVDSVPVMDISPDDVVGIIGQKHFWKARRAIVNQQRVFAVQVFELHRLIKVQKLIAGSPHLLLEDASGLSKPSSKISPAEKVAEECNAKSPSSAVVKHRDEPSKPSHPVECSAENAVGKPLTAANRSTPPEPRTPDARMGSWGGQSQPAGNHQWLIPVMSPTEGLVYKPYPGNGFSGGGLGGFGPYGAPPMMGNYANPIYGVPAHPHQPFLPGVPHGGHSYFPTYGMPIMPTPIQGQGSEQICFSEPVSCVQMGIVSVGDTNHQSSCTAPIPRAAASAPTKLHISKEPDFQGSTPSSPVKRAEEIPTVSASEQVNRAVSKQPPNQNSYNLQPSSPGERLEGFRPILGKDGRKGALSLFPVVAVDADQPARVIKAVPHNPRSASETVARIFRSIQEERKQYDSA